MKRYIRFQIELLNIVKLSIFPKLVFRFNKIPVKNFRRLFCVCGNCQVDSKILNGNTNSQEEQKTNLKNSRVEDLCYQISNYYKPTVIKTRTKQTNKQNSVVLVKGQKSE